MKVTMKQLKADLYSSVPKQAEVAKHRFRGTGTYLME